MKWIESLGALISFLVLTQLIKWILDSLGMNNSIGEAITFFLSAIFSTLIIIVFMLTQQYSDIKKIKEYLSKKGFKEDKGFVEKMFKQKKKNKKGYMVDPRILWWIIILIILYLLWKSGFFANLFG